MASAPSRNVVTKKVTGVKRLFQDGMVGRL